MGHLLEVFQVKNCCRASAGVHQTLMKCEPTHLQPVSELLQYNINHSLLFNTLYISLISVLVPVPKKDKMQYKPPSD